MDDLIRRGALLAAMGLETATKYGNKSAEQQHRSYSTWMSYEIADEINGAPTIDPVRHAHWWAPFAGCAICSACNEEQDVEMFVGNPVQKYCARCGARMDGEGEKDEADKG